MKLNELLSQIESDAGKLIVMYLRRTGTATVDQICSTLGLTKMKAYSVLKSLRESGYIAPLQDSAQERYALKQIEL